MSTYDTATLPITELETGDGYADSRLGVLYAPPGAAPGSMMPLKHFLEERGVRTLPGYSSEGRHVLRLAGFKDDASLLHLLKQDFPVWQTEKQVCPVIDTSGLTTPRNLGAGEQLPSSPLKNYSGTLTGLSYLTGDVALLLSAARQQMPGQEAMGLKGANLFRGGAGLSYMLANLVLIGFGNTSKPPRPAKEILHEASHALATSPEHQPEIAREMKHQQGHVLNFIARHPWEIACLFSTAGTSLQIASGIHNARRKGEGLGEVAASFGILVAMLIPLVVPEKGGRVFLNVGKLFGRDDDTSFADTLHEFAEKHPHAGLLERTYDWMQERPLRASAYVSQVANLGHIAYGMSNRKDYAYAGSYGMYLLGNSIQSLTSKGRGAGLDSLLSNAADYLATQPHATPEERASLQQGIERLAALLSEAPDVNQSPKKLARGITKRLASIQGNPAPGNTPYLPEETATMRQSPFLSGHEIARLKPEGSDAGVAR